MRTHYANGQPVHPDNVAVGCDCCRFEDGQHRGECKAAWRDQTAVCWVCKQEFYRPHYWAAACEGCAKNLANPVDFAESGPTVSNP